MPLPLFEPTYRDDPSIPGRGASPGAAEAALAFGRFRALLRRRQLLADGVPIELGARAFDILAVLLESDGLLVTKEELFSRVWPDRIVEENNLHAQVSALRKALGDSRDFIRTESGRGYRLIAAVRAIAAPSACRRMRRQSNRSDRWPVRRRTDRRMAHGW